MNLVSDSEQEYKKTPCCGLRPCRNEEGFLADVGKSVGQRSGLAAKRSDSEAVLQRSGLALAFSQVCTLTGLRGRWETVREHPLTICDTGHNAHGIKYVAEQLQTLMPHYRNTRIIFGMVADKDISEVVRLLPRDAIYYFTQPDNHRAFPAEELLKMFEDEGLRTLLDKGARSKDKRLNSADSETSETNVISPSSCVLHPSSKESPSSCVFHPSSKEFLTYIPQWSQL